MSPSGTPYSSGEMDLDLDSIIKQNDADVELLKSIDPEYLIDWDDDEEMESSVSLLASADPGQPLSTSPAMGAALAEIASGAPASRTVRNERPADALDPHTRFRALVVASQVKATRKAEADKAAAMGQPAPLRPSNRNRPTSGSSSPATDKKAKSDHPAPGPIVMDITEVGPVRNRSTSSMQSFGSPSTPRPTSQKPTKPSKSPAELEMLRLKDRRTLHSLAR